MKHLLSTIAVIILASTNIFANTGAVNVNSPKSQPKVSHAFISSKVWNDVNNDGIMETSENGIANINVILINNETGSVVAEAKTDANGNYSFNNVAPGNYLVSFETPNGYYISPAINGNESNKNLGGVTESFSLTAGDIITNLHSGFYSESTIGLK